ncbi:putative HTH-type transcriptional regulator YdfL [Cladorrhinum sp. PSN332]|nr:putative HTH-type transcriptional regulator YdfL [Cladorrhinum sp. PSN332]
MASQLYDALLTCLCGSSSGFYVVPQLPRHHDDRESSPLITQKPTIQSAPHLDHLSVKDEKVDSSAIENIIFHLVTARSAGSSLDTELDSAVETTGWSENIAKRVLRALEEVLKPENQDKRSSWGEALTEAYNKAVEVAAETFRELAKYAKEHPTQTEIVCAVLLSLFAYGVLVQLAPRILMLLGFGVEGPVEGSFAAWFMSTYGGYVPKGSLMSYLQRLGMTWGKVAGRL